MRMQGRSATPVKKCLRLFFVMLVVAAFSVGVQSKTSDKKKALHPKTPELKLRIVPDKETYVLYERVFAKAELLNLTDKTQCFPEPAQGVEVPSSGYLVTTAGLLDPPENEQSESDQFLEGFCGGLTWPAEKLRSEIEESWVKLAPNQVYVVKLTKALVNLRSSGQWQLKATYQPPQCSFNFDECMKYLRSEAKKVGCTVPEIRISAESIQVNVAPPPDQK